MSGRARLFVEYWIGEFLHPDLYEDEETFSESRANAAACLRDAACYGIEQSEIEAEVGDLVAHIARMHERIVDFQLRHPAGWGPSAAAA
jgi:hypothetical protein